MTIRQDAIGFVLFAMALATPATAMAQSQTPAPVSPKLPPGLTFSVGVGTTSRVERFGDFQEKRTLPISASVEVALNRFMLAQGEVLNWRERSNGIFRGSPVSGPLGAGYSGDFVHEDRERNTAIVGNFLGRFGGGRVFGTLGFGAGVIRSTGTFSARRVGCVPHYVNACDFSGYSGGGTSTSFTVQFLAGADVMLTPRLTAFANIRSIASDGNLTTMMGGVRWTVRRKPVSPGWRADANPAAAPDAIGKAVHVEAFDHSRHNGTLVSLTDTHVTIRSWSGAMTLPLSEVRGIRRQTHAILRGTLAGLGGGLGAGLILCALEGGCGDEGGWVAMATMGLGAGIGGGIGAVYNLSTADARTVYVNPRKASLSVTPIVDTKRAGFGGRITW